MAAELKRLKRENEILRQERDILKTGWGTNTDPASNP